MIFASINDRSRRDGIPILINESQTHFGRITNYNSLLEMIDEWPAAIKSVEELECNEPLGEVTLASPLPRSWQFLDGSAFLEHVRRARRARGAEFPDELLEVPLMYQGVSAPFTGPSEDIECRSEEHGIDFEAELAVVVKETPMGVSAADAENSVALIMLLNDVSLRELIPAELGRGFGFVQGKPLNSFAPFAITPDSLGANWNNGKPNIDVVSKRNGEQFGRVSAAEMHFSFYELISHAAKTRPLAAGTIIGSGTVANTDESRGASCIVEKRILEKIHSGNTSTPYLKDGETVSIEAFLGERSLFGEISQRVRIL